MRLMSGPDDDMGTTARRHKAIIAGACITSPVWLSVAILSVKLLLAPDGGPHRVPELQHTSPNRSTEISKRCTAKVKALQQQTLVLQRRMEVEKERSDTLLAAAKARYQAVEADLAAARGELQRSNAEQDRVLQQSRAELAKTKQKLLRTQANLVARERRIAKLELALGLRTADPKGFGSTIWAELSTVHHQQTLAGVAGLLGVLGVIGPAAFVRCFLATIGSAVGGLMAGACVRFFLAMVGCNLVPVTNNFSWSKCVEALARGNGGIAGNIVWSSLLILGILRCLLTWECTFDAAIRDVYARRPMADFYLRRPLLCGQKNGDSTANSTSLSSAGLGLHPTRMPQQDGSMHAGVQHFDMGSPRDAGDPTRGLGRITALVEQASRLAAAGSTVWPKMLWSWVEAAVHSGTVSDEVVTVVAAHGFRPGRPDSSQAPNIPRLQRALEALHRSNAQDAVPNVLQDSICS